ncbi:PIG-L family deacetylase [Roseomonas hellenica]|uniref:PIG-L family deacetylase n=1 Tax=Plastoroseomonas hellenica TaxID=2687306 RepID=A0ABS5EYU0_9PROT|nr:PIG-L family deacetylase [Plastoroseomonas hellenica]MBR0665458.1 PIG-L family deacetylase [Plastoroseomonas hellenica]
MKAGAWLDQARRHLPIAPTPAALLAGAAPVLVLAPHPDDETLGCGALIAACAAEGRAVHVVIVSDGRGSHPGSRSHPPARLVATRAEEAREAVAVLGLDPDRDLTFLGIDDRAVPRQGPGLMAACDAIRRILPAPPGVVLAPWRHDPHGDHEATAEIASVVVGGWPGTLLLSYIVWGWAYATPLPGFVLDQEPTLADAPRGWRFDAGPWLAAKRDAIAAHRSQTSGLIEDVPDGFRLSAEALALQLQPTELYLT